MEEIDYQRLYLLQDKVLKLVADLDNDFYLTGGTALHRFYYDARYSDDLDFFVSSGVNFAEDVQEVVETLKSQNYRVREDVKARDFYRVMVDDFLQLDFVNDRVYRYKKSEIINGIRIDNKINILTNKLNAILNRDEEKDIFDLFCIAFHEEFQWREVLEIADKKAPIQKEFLIYRLKSFPLEWLEKIKQIKNIAISEKDIITLCDDVMCEGKNSLFVREV